MRSWRLISFAYVILATLAIGCMKRHSLDDYKETVRDGIHTFPHVQEIKGIFPEQPTDHFITQFGFEKDKPVVWNTEVFFGGRYEFTYQVYVLVDYERNRISRMVSNPKFDLRELARIDENGQGWYQSDHHFGEEEWNKVVAARGDFSVIGIQLNTNAPLPGFDQFVRACRAPRVQVEP